MSEFKQRGPQRSFDVEYERGNPSEGQPREQRPAHKPEEARKTADALDSCHERVSKSVAEMKTAAVSGDLAAWTQAKRAADAGVAQIRDAVTPALEAVSETRDSGVRKRLLGVRKLLNVATELVEHAPPAPKRSAQRESPARVAAQPAAAPTSGGGEVHGPADRPIADAPKRLVPDADQPPRGTTIQVPDADHPARRDLDGEQVIQTGKTTEPGKATPVRGKSWKSLAQVAESVDVQDDSGDSLHIEITYRLESRPSEVGEVPDIWIHTERKALLTIGSGEHAGATIVGQARLRLAPDEARDPKAAIAKPSIGPDHWAQIYLAEAKQYVNLTGAGGRASLLEDAAGNDVLAYDDPLRTLVGLKNILKQQHVAGHGGDAARMHERAQRMLADAKRGRVVLEREIASVASHHDPHPGKIAPVRFLAGDITEWLAANQHAGRDATEDADQLRKARAELEHLIADAEHTHAPKRDQLDDALSAPVRFVERTAEGAAEVGAMVVDGAALGVNALGKRTGIGTFDYHPISKYAQSIDETGANTTTALVAMINGFADGWTDAIERAKHGDYRSLTDVSVDTLMMVDGARTGGTIALEKSEALAAKLGTVAKSAHAIASRLPTEVRNIAAAMGDGADAFVSRLRAGGMQMATEGGGGGPGPNLAGLSAETLAEAAQAAKKAFKDARLAQDAPKPGERAAANTDDAAPANLLATAVAEPADPAEWLAKLEHGLSPDEIAKLDKMKAGKSLAEQRAMFDGDLETSREKVRATTRLGQEAAALKAQSKVRVEELKRAIADRGLMREPEIIALMEDVSKKPKDKLPTLRDKLMAKILKVEVQAANPNTVVFDGVKLYEKLPEASIADWKTKHPGQKTDGLIEREQGLYMQRGELDIMVVERDPGGARGKIRSREEIKTGVVDTDAKAKSQLTAQSDLFKDAASGAKNIRLEVGGRDIADEIDLASDAFASKSSRGPAGKGFDNSLGVTASDLEALCKDLLKSSPAPEKTTP